MDTATKTRAGKYALSIFDNQVPKLENYANNHVQRRELPAAALRIVERLERQGNEANEALKKLGYEYPGNNVPRYSYFMRCDEQWKDWDTVSGTVFRDRERHLQRMMRAIWNNEIDNFDQIDEMVERTSNEHALLIRTTLEKAKFFDKVPKSIRKPEPKTPPRRPVVRRLPVAK